MSTPTHLDDKKVLDEKQVGGYGYSNEVDVDVQSIDTITELVAEGTGVARQ